MKVTALTRYDVDAASTRVRFAQYAKPLKEAGVSLRIEPLLPADYMKHRFSSPSRLLPSILEGYARRLHQLSLSDQSDVWWVHSEALPFSPLDIDIWSHLGRSYVLDLDDSVHLKYQQRRAFAVRRFLGGKIARLVRHAKAVTAGSPFLVEWAHASNPKGTYYIPTVVDTSLVRPVVPIQSRERLVVGWIGSPSTTSYIEDLIPTLERLASLCPIVLRVIGATPLKSSRLIIDQRPWRLEDEVEALNSFDIGIMPLQDDDWARGKCAFKLIQYMAVGRPVVASRVGANTSVVSSDCGFLVDTEEDWLSTLTQLCKDTELRRRMGWAGRRRVVEHYSVRSNAPRVARILQAAGGDAFANQQ